MAQDMGSISGFRPKYYLDGRSWTSAIERIPVHTSKTVRVGEAIHVVGGGGVDPINHVDDKVYGYVVGFETLKSIPLKKAVSGTDYDGTFTEAVAGDTYLASSDNLTDKKVMALVVPAEGLVVSGKLDANAGTTTGSNLANYYLDTNATDASLIAESSSLTTIGNFKTVGVKGNETSCIDPEAPGTADRRILVQALELQNVGDGKAEAD